MLVATAHAAEVSELNRKLWVADEELDRINKWFDETQGMHTMLRNNLFTYQKRYIHWEINSYNFCLIMIIDGAAEVETLKGALAEVKEEAEGNKAAADKAAIELEAKQVTRRQYEA